MNHITNFGLIFAVSLYFIGLLTFIINGGNNLIMLVISLELLLLAIGVLFAHFSFLLDDIIGISYTFYLLSLAGAEAAILLSILIAYYPSRGTLLVWVKYNRTEQNRTEQNRTEQNRTEENSYKYSKGCR